MDFMIYADLLNNYLGNKYLTAVIIVALFAIASEIFLWIMQHIVLSLAKKTKTKVDDEIVKACRRPLAFILLMVGIKIALHTLDLSETLLKIFLTTTNSFVIFFVALMIMRIIDILIDNWGRAWARRTKSTIDDSLLLLFHRFSRVTVIIIAFIMILGLWEIDVTGLLAGLGIAGIAIGFAVKDSLANIFGGISVILDKSVKVGDIIKLDSGEEGTVMDVGIRTTKIRTWDNEMISIPNGVLANSKITNKKMPDLRLRVVIPFGVEYGTKYQKVEKAVLEALKKVKNISKDPKPRVRFLEMADFALNFKAYVWVDDLSLAYDTKENAVKAIYDALNKAKIGIPFPTRTIFMKKMK